MCILAIDIGGTKIALGLVQENQIVERAQFPTPTVESAEQLVAAILAHCQPWMDRVTAIGVSTTGLVIDKSISAINPDTLAFPAPFPFGEALEQACQKPVSMLNDAQAAAWFEYVKLGSSMTNMAFITVSTGVGGGIVIDGKLHSGAGGLAGHIGHSVVDLNGPQCGCGQYGCVEAIASGTAIKKISDQHFAPAISNIELFAQANTNQAAEKIIQSSANAIAALCCNLKATLDLEIIIIGGGVGLASGYIDRIKSAIAQRPKAFHVPIQAAQGDYDTCLLGAAYLVGGKA